MAACWTPQKKTGKHSQLPVQTPHIPRPPTFPPTWKSSIAACRLSTSAWDAPQGRLRCRPSCPGAKWREVTGGSPWLGPAMAASWSAGRGRARQQGEERPAAQGSATAMRRQTRVAQRQWVAALLPAGTTSQPPRQPCQRPRLGRTRSGRLQQRVKELRAAAVAAVRLQIAHRGRPPHAAGAGHAPHAAAVHVA